MCCLSKAFECFVVGNDRISFCGKNLRGGSNENKHIENKNLVSTEIYTRFSLNDKKVGNSARQNCNRLCPLSGKCKCLSFKWYSNFFSALLVSLSAVLLYFR